MWMTSAVASWATRRKERQNGTNTVALSLPSNRGRRTCSVSSQAMTSCNRQLPSSMQRQRLWSTDSPFSHHQLLHRSDSPLSAAKPRWLPLPPSGTHSQKTSPTHLLCSCFSIAWNPFCSGTHSWILYCHPCRHSGQSLSVMCITLSCRRQWNPAA